MTDTKLLQGIKAICKALGLSEQQFYLFLQLQMPVRQINGRWYAHVDNLDAFFSRLTQAGKPITVSRAPRTGSPLDELEEDWAAEFLAEE